MNNHLIEITQCTSKNWKPAIDDPHIMGWITVLCYAISALLAFKTYRNALAASQTKIEVTFFLCLALTLALLTVNKQLDLQTLLTAAARCESQISGWYANRRSKQAFFILMLILLGLACIMLSTYILRQHIRKLVLVIIGIGFLLTYILIRAVSFHHIDILIGTTIATWRINWIVELNGIFLVVFGTLTANQQYRRG